MITSSSRFDKFLNKQFSTNDLIFHLNCFCIFIAVFIISFIFVPLYWTGDQAVYIRIYDTIPTLSYEEIRWNEGLVGSCGNNYYGQ